MPSLRSACSRRVDVIPRKRCLTREAQRLLAQGRQFVLTVAQGHRQTSQHQDEDQRAQAEVDRHAPQVTVEPQTDIAMHMRECGREQRHQHIGQSTGRTNGPDPRTGQADCRQRDRHQIQGHERIGAAAAPEQQPSQRRQIDTQMQGQLTGMQGLRMLQTPDHPQLEQRQQQHAQPQRRRVQGQTQTVQGHGDGQRLPGQRRAAQRAQQAEKFQATGVHAHTLARADTRPATI